MSDEFYRKGVQQMIDEGLETVTKMLQSIKQQNESMKNFSREQKIKTITSLDATYDGFYKIHPIVFEYIISEDVFNRNAFKRYIRDAFGKPRSQEEMKLVSQDQRNALFIKNRKNALYYKYLLREFNPTLPIRSIENLYEEMVNTLNEETRKMLEKFDAIKESVERKGKTLDAEKKNELVDYLRNVLSGN